MRKRVSAIILKDNKILLIHRFKYGQEYYSVPGGGVEEGESLEQALVREIKEEMNLDINVGSLLTTTPSLYHGQPQKNYYYLVSEFSGEPKLGNGPELDRANHHNRYHPEWVNLKNIAMLPLIKPSGAKEVLAKVAKRKPIFQCSVCGFHYRNEESAKRCEAWCRGHKSCNLEIVKEAIEVQKVKGE